MEVDNLLDKIKTIHKKYRPIPFWSWNEKLDTKETKRQIKMMNDVGMGGFFMHARGGLQTEYMGEEWFENVKASIEEAKNLSMDAWGYDENGWPSGFGGGLVNGLGEKYQQKYLRMEYGEKNIETTICNIDGVHFYYEVNPFYVDTLDKDVIKEFLDKIYKPYYEKFKGKMRGFFTDEPQVSRNGIPWSFILADEYSKEYGEDIYLNLIELFEEKGDYKNTRIKFWRLVSKLFSQSYSKQIYDWCNEHGFEFTGHFVLEDNLICQVTSNGSVMPGYEYYHIPAIDLLSRRVVTPLIPLQVTSVAHQTGKRQILTETYALCGHNVSFDELKWILESQMVRGVNLLCPHLQGYSLRGLRKRDYPPAMYYQQPWWKDYKIFIDAMSRIGMLIAEGGLEFDTLFIHPQTTAWSMFNVTGKGEIEKFNKKFTDALCDVERKHILFHLGDEIIMERHAKVEGNKLVIGNMSYSKIVLMPDTLLFENTKRLLSEFKNNGGRILTPDEIENNDVIDNPEITYTKRVFEDFDVHYFVNTTQEVQKSNIKVGNAKLNIVSGDVEAFNGIHTFEPMGSIVVIDKKNYMKKYENTVKKDNINIFGKWEIKEASPNAFVLDYCDCYFDDVLYEKDIHINHVHEAACSLKRKVDVRLVYKFNSEFIPENISLVCETPEIFKFKINGRDLTFKDNGYFVDFSFRKSDINGFLKQGENILEVFCEFEQSQKTYENIENCKTYENGKNKLTYDMELEAMYLIGEFSVKCDGGFENLDKNAVRSNEKLVISEPVKEVELKNIEQQGFAFFAGTITLLKKIKVDDIDKKFKFTLNGINSAGVKVNGKELGTLIFTPFEYDLSDALKLGENEIELTLTNNLRNLLGPHHLEEGESYDVGPADFFKESQLWHGKPWNDNYCFVETSVHLKL